jgi:DNA replication and repair protein RecF
MWLRRLELRAFRNIHEAGIDLAPGFNFFFGDNGAGKTAVLEAVHVFARGRSFRTSHIDELIERGSPTLVIRASGQDEHVGTQRLVFARSRNGGTEVRINGESGRRMSQIAMLFPLEVMTPAMTDLVFGGPAGRREWLDWGVFHVKHDYLATSRRYAAALRQRNAGLKAHAQGRMPIEDLQPWTREVATLGALVDQARRAHFDDMTSRVSEALAALSSDLEVELVYRRGWPEGHPLENVLGDSTGREVKSGATLAGPHRADIELRSAAQPCSATLSRGQAKVLASALMLAQADAIRGNGERAGLFLIDDIGAELDSSHRRRLFQALVGRGSQVLATSVERPESEVLAHCGAYRMFHVERGSVSPA